MNTQSEEHADPTPGDVQEIAPLDADAQEDGTPPEPAHAPPSPPPRVATALACRRALTEPRVRFWVLAAIALACIGIEFFISSFTARAHERWLIDHGVKIDGLVWVANGEGVANRPQPPDSELSLRFLWNGSEFTTDMMQLPGRKEFIYTGSMLPIRVNPSDPNDWTWLSEPLPMLHRTIGAIITLPIAALTMIWAMLKRRRLLRTWQMGEAVEALIVQTRATAVAPLCRAATVTPADESDRRIYTVYLPRHLATLERGDSVYIVRPSAGARSAIAAAWFEPAD